MADDSVDDYDSSRIKMRQQRGDSTIVFKKQVKKLDQSLNSEIVQTLEREQEDISAIYKNNASPIIMHMENGGSIFKAAINQAAI